MFEISVILLIVCTAHGYYSNNNFIYAHDHKNIFTRPINA